MKNLFLRKIFVAAAVVLSVCLAACGDGKKKAPAPAPVQEENAFTDEAPVLKTSDPMTAEKSVPDESKSSIEDLRFDGTSKIRKTSARENGNGPLPEVSRDNILVMKDEDAAKMLTIQQKRRSAWNILQKNPDSSVAGLLADPVVKPGHTLVWLPKQASGAVMPVRLSDMRLSPDGSVMVFAETTGKAEGPFGTRLVLMNTASWRVLKIVEFNRNATRFIWIPGALKIAALCESQSISGQKNGIAVIDLQSGKEIGFVQVKPDTGKTTFMADTHGHIYLSDPAKPELLVLPVDALEPAARTVIKVPSANCVVALSADGKRFAVAPGSTPDGKGQILLFDAQTLQAVSRVVFTAEPGAFGGLLYLASDQNFFLAGKSGSSGKSFLIRGNSVYNIDGWTSGGLAVSPDRKQIYLGLREQNKVLVIDAENGAVLRTIDVNRAEPKLLKPPAGRVLFMDLLPQISALAMLDDQGNFFLVQTELQGKAKYAERAIIFHRFVPRN